MLKELSKDYEKNLLNDSWLMIEIFTMYSVPIAQNIFFAKRFLLFSTLNFTITIINTWVKPVYFRTAILYIQVAFAYDFCTWLHVVSFSMIRSYFGCMHLTLLYIQDSALYCIWLIVILSLFQVVCWMPTSGTLRRYTMTRRCSIRPTIVPNAPHTTCFDLTSTHTKSKSIAFVPV